VALRLHAAGWSGLALGPIVRSCSCYWCAFFKYISALVISGAGIHNPPTSTALPVQAVVVGARVLPELLACPTPGPLGRAIGEGPGCDGDFQAPEHVFQILQLFLLLHPMARPISAGAMRVVLLCICWLHPTHRHTPPAVHVRLLFCSGSAPGGLVWQLLRLVGLLCSVCQSGCARCVAYRG
jgi:hypothetical protein